MSLPHDEASTTKDKLTMNQMRHLGNIHKEIFLKDHEELKKLLSVSDFETINKKYAGETALDLAINLRDHVSVEILLAHRAIPNYNEPHHIWPTSTFARAIRSENLKIVQLLVNQGCDPDTLLEINNQQDVIPDTIPYNYWYKTVELDNISMFQCLLRCNDRKIDNQQERSKKILLLACGLGSITTVEYLLDQGLSVECADEKNWTCLFYAVAYRQISVIRLLITRGANLKSRDHKDRTLLHISVFYHELASSKGESPTDVIRLLLEKDADINATDNEGLTPINAAFTVKNINYDIINCFFLSRRHINVSKPDIHGVTVLHRLISTGYNDPNIYNQIHGDYDRFNIFRDVLYRLDVDINAQDEDGRTPLQFVNDKSLNHLSVLLDLGADTKVLQHLKEDMFKISMFISILLLYKTKRSVADLSNDPNIDALLAQLGVFCDETHWNFSQASLSYLDEIQRLKKTILCDKLTFYDFLHAKKRTCIKIAKKPGVREKLEKLMERRHGFSYYGLMLTKNYLNGVRPLTPIESEAIDSVEKNLDVVFNYKLPNLVVYNIKKYIDIEDMITLQNINHVAV